MVVSYKAMTIAYNHVKTFHKIPIMDKLCICKVRSALPIYAEYTLVELLQRHQTILMKEGK